MKLSPWPIWMVLLSLGAAALGCNMLPGLPVTPTVAPTLTPTPTPPISPTPVALLPTDTFTPTPTETPSPTPTATETATHTASATPSYTFTPTSTPSGTWTPLPTNTPAPTSTSTFTETVTPSATPTHTATATDTSTPTFTASATPSPLPSATPTNTPAPVVITATLVPTRPITLTPTPTNTRTPQIFILRPPPTNTRTATPLPTVIIIQPPTLLFLASSTPIPASPIPATPFPTALSFVPTPFVVGRSEGIGASGAELALPTRDDLQSVSIGPSGRRAEVTLDGQLLIDGQPYNGNGKHLRQTFRAVQWSPDGTWLAYLVETPNAEAGQFPPQRAIDDGVWVVAPGGEPRHVLRNHYISGSNEFPKRIARDLAWANDQDALIISVTVQGNLTMTILTGRSRFANEQLPGLFDILPYRGDAWLPDSSGWVATTADPNSGAVLGIVNRNTAAFTPVYYGAAAGLWMQDAALMANGRYGFLGSPSADGRNLSGGFNLRLYGLTPVGSPAPLMSAPFPGEVIRAEWSPNRTAVLVHCRENGVIRSFVVDMNGSQRELTPGSLLISWR